jgi:protein-L-isoaspartate(D-aspartate) O-methyltransferase
MNTELARFNMIEQQIRPWDVLDAQVLELLARVKREDFVPAEHKALAFVDTQVPLLPGQPRGPAMLEPKVEARLLQALRWRCTRRALGARGGVARLGRAACAGESGRRRRSGRAARCWARRRGGRRLRARA